MRLPTISQETFFIMIFIFCAQFVNTGFIVMLSDANFKDIDGGNGPLSNIFSVGKETDFSEQWYRTTGMLIMRTMLIAAVYPVMEFCGFWSLAQFKRLRDRNYTSDVFQTQMPSVSTYVEMYSGPEYMIHFRYSAILLQVGVSFLYGAAMPLLYPIAGLAFFVLYIWEHLLVCYYYREPPAFDETMTLKSLKTIELIALITLPFNYWQLGNLQIFDTKVFDFQTSKDIVLSGHNLEVALNLEKFQWNTPLLLVFFMLIFYIIYDRFLQKEKKKTDEDDLVEGLAEFYEAIEAEDRKDIIASETHFYRKY